MRLGKLSEVYKIDGKAMVSPQSVNVQFESLASPESGRTDDGVMHITYIWRKIRKISIKLPSLSQEEISDILSKVQGKEYTLTYLDPIEGVTQKKVYTSNTSTDLYSGILYGGVWQGAGFNAIELAGEK